MVELPLTLRRKTPATTSIHQKPPPKIPPQLWVWLGRILVFIALVLLGFGCYQLYQKAAQQKITQVYIEGVEPAQQQILAQYLAPTLQGNYFTLDLPTVRDRALTVPWVERVVVSRAWSDTVVVRVIPRVATARWGTGRYLSDDGQVFQTFRSPKQPLPLLQGPITQAPLMMARYQDITQLFAPLHLRVKELYLTDRMTWFIQFDSGLRIIVDQNQTMAKLQRLAALGKSDLKPVWIHIAAVDLRYRNGLALQWKQGQAPPVTYGKFRLQNATPAPAT